jgi:peptide/nickel transport system substrate-binding protein
MSAGCGDPGSGRSATSASRSTRSTPRRPSSAASLSLLVLFSASASASSPAAPQRILKISDDVVEPISLDPLREFSEKYYTIIQQIFDSLVRFDPDGRLEPDLATSWRWVDDKTLEFKLRRGVRFHDGEPFDAEAVRVTIKKFIDPQSAFPGAGMLDSIAGAEVVDPLTIRIKTKYPDGILLHRLAGLVPILPPRYLAGKGRRYFGRHPVGTGAFRFVSWEPGKAIHLGANRDYWRQGFPKADGLAFLFLPTAEQIAGLLDGRVDIVTELPGTATMAVVKSGRAKIVKKGVFYTVAGSVNVSSSVLSDVRVRRAINYAINRADLIRYDLLGNGVALPSLTMKGEIGHDPALTPYPYDPAEARRLLREAGYPRGLTLKGVVKVQGERTMRIIARQLERVGIRLVTTKTTDATVIRDIQRGGWDFTFGGCPDPLAHSFFIQFIFLSSYSPYSIHKSAVFDRLMAEMTSTLDPSGQDRAGRKLDRYVHDQALSLFTYQRIKTYGVAKDIHFVAYKTGMPYFYLSSIE